MLYKKEIKTTFKKEKSGEVIPFIIKYIKGSPRYRHESNSRVHPKMEQDTFGQTSRSDFQSHGLASIKVLESPKNTRSLQDNPIDLIKYIYGEQ